MLLLTHTSLNVLKLARILPPAQSLPSLPSGAKILTLAYSGAKALTSFSSRSGIPKATLLPPARTTLSKRVRRRERSQEVMEEVRREGIGEDSEPRRRGEKKISRGEVVECWGRVRGVPSGRR